MHLNMVSFEGFAGLSTSVADIHIYLYTYIYIYIYLIQKHSECKKRSGQKLKKGQDEKDLKSKWAAKAGVALVLMRIKF